MTGPKLATLISLIFMVPGALFTLREGDWRHVYLPLFLLGSMVFCVAAVLYQDWSMLLLELIFFVINSIGVWRVYFKKR